jgi:alkanesulfonate monooxygenase SsuD/methylene tetrahydromethanopterin reductase-like flavin-dependent oxidoreductase (luciferase family)
VDAGLRDGVANHHGRYWQIENLRLVPRPFQQPSPPRWTTVVSTESARRVAQRGSKDMHELPSRRAYPPDLRRVP